MATVNKTVHELPSITTIGSNDYLLIDNNVASIFSSKKIAYSDLSTSISSTLNITQIETDVSNVITDVSNVTSDIVDIQNNIINIESNVASVIADVANVHSIPAGGDAGYILKKLTNDDYNADWIAPTAPTATGWGSIVGTLNDQVDLKNKFDTKANVSGQTFTGKIYAENLSNSNTGDEDQLSILNKIGVSNVVAGSYTSTNLTVNEYGFITSAENGTGGGGTWGTITGTLTDQTDLIDALNLKANVSGQIFTGNVSANVLTSNVLSLNTNILVDQNLSTDGVIEITVNGAPYYLQLLRK